MSRSLPHAHVTRATQRPQRRALAPHHHTIVEPGRHTGLVNPIKPGRFLSYARADVAADVGIVLLAFVDRARCSVPRGNHDDATPWSSRDWLVTPQRRCQAKPDPTRVNPGIGTHGFLPGMVPIVEI